MIFLVRGRCAENIEKKKNTDRRKTLLNQVKKNKEYKKSQITTMNILGVTFYIKNYILLKNIVWKKLVYIIKINLQFLFVGGYLKRGNDTPKLNMHKYNNYNMTKIYINRLRTTTQIFIAILMSENYAHFRKWQNHVARNFFPTVYFGNVFQIMYISKICTKTWKKLE